MNNSEEHNANPRTESPARHIPGSEQDPEQHEASASASDIPIAMPGPMADNAAGQYAPHDAAQGHYTKSPDNKPSSPQAMDSTAGKEQAESHSHPVGADILKGKWNQLMGAAKTAWGKLTDDELLKSEGQAQKLAGLVQQRYAITHDEASQQVKDFLKQHNS